MSLAEVARVTTFVQVSPLDAFEVFTQEVDLWWRRGPRFRGGGPDSELVFEEDERGRCLIERGKDGTFELGRVQVWEPGKRLVLDYRLRNFAEGESTTVEVRFEAFASGTRVVLEHRGWENIREGHPARHGMSGAALGGMIGTHWGQLASAFREFVAKR
jgi:uncharacterized protein YndB with AHSA1/START domain